MVEAFLAAWVILAMVAGKVTDTPEEEHWYLGERGAESAYAASHIVDVPLLLASRAVRYGLPLVVILVILKRLHRREKKYMTLPRGWTIEGHQRAQERFHTVRTYR